MAILPKIEKWIESDEILTFKVGITDNIEERRQGYTSQHDVKLFKIAEGSNQAIIQAEKDLIDYFLASRFREKCKNEPNTGGKGNVEKADELYVAIEYVQTKTIKVEDLHVPFCDIEPVNLQ